MAHSVHRHVFSPHLITNVGKLSRRLIKTFSIRRLKDVSLKKRLNDIQNKVTTVRDIGHFAEVKELLQFTVRTVTA